MVERVDVVGAHVFLEVRLIGLLVGCVGGCETVLGACC